MLQKPSYGKSCKFSDQIKKDIRLATEEFNDYLNIPKTTYESVDSSSSDISIDFFTPKE